MGEELRHVQMSRCTQVKEASNNKGYEVESKQFILMQQFITKTSSKGRQQCLYIQVMKK